MDSIRWLPNSFHVQPMMISLAWAMAMAGARKEGGGCRGHFLSARTESGWADHGAQSSCVAVILHASICMGSNGTCTLNITQSNVEMGLS